MQNVLKFVQSAKADELYTIEHGIRKRFKELEEQIKLERAEHEQSEREQQWKLWKERTLVILEDIGNRRVAVEEAYKTLSNLWIERDGEIPGGECPECGEDYDDYYEFLFCKGINACSECTDTVDLRAIFDEMEDDIQKNKKLKN